MAKNIVLCSDGTTNSGGTGNATNVWRVFSSVDLNGFKEKKIDVEQVAFYDDGVGTERGQVLRILGAALGLGLGRNVRQLYTDLVRNYQPGDHIYLFGYSRGAFTVRTLAGLVGNCGILDYRRFDDDEELKDGVRNLYRAYRHSYRALLSPLWYGLERLVGINRPADVDALRIRVSVKVKATEYESYENLAAPFEEDHRVPIRFIGIWDTVDAVGFPVDEMTKFWNKYIFRITFPAGNLNPWVNRACHAISIDDDRKAFHPVMLDEKGDANKTRIDQVWFPGAHGSVGGGHPKQGLAHVAMNWVMRKAEAEGLMFDADSKSLFARAANEQDALPDARSGMSIYYRYAPRNIGEISEKNNVDPVRIHISALKRIALGTGQYAPGNFPANFEIEVDDPSNIGESSKAQKNLRDIIRKEIEASGDAYTRRGLVEKRMLLHRWFWLATLAVLGFGAVLQETSVASTEPQGWVLLLMNIVEYLIKAVPLVGEILFNNFLRPLFLFPKVGLMVLLTPVVLYCVDYLIKRRQIRYRQKVWRKLLRGVWW